MRPVDQTAFGAHDGDCFTACVASILELPIEAVPAFVLYREAWLARFWEWLAAHDLDATLYRDDCAPPGFSIAGGHSPRFPGRIHACVAYDGAVVHDPHPSRDGLPAGIVSYIAIYRPL